jgi:hypothetical protein
MRGRKTVAEDKTAGSDKGVATEDLIVVNAARHTTKDHNRRGKSKDTRRANTGLVLSGLVVLRRDPSRM